MTVFMPRQWVKSMQRRLMTAADGTISPFTGEEQVQDWGGEWWEYDLEFAVHQGRDGAEVSVFFDQLGGRRGSFLLRDPSYQLTAPGTPLVNGAGQSGNTLATDGWPASTTVLRMGDAFQLGSGATTRLHRLTANATSNGAGQCTLNFVPRLRVSPLDNAALVVAQPAVHLRLIETVPSMIERAALYRFSLKAREVL